MKPYDLKAQFPYASKSFIEKNYNAWEEDADQLFKLGKVQVIDAAPKPKQRRAPRAKELNELEKSFFFDYLIKQFPISKIKPQSIALKLAHKCKYTPDFYVCRLDLPARFYEVKGPHMWEDSWIKLKVAATEYPEFEFWFAEKVNGEWKTFPIPRS